MLLLAGCAQQTAGGDDSNDSLKASQANAVKNVKQKLSALPAELPDLYRANETSVDLGTDILKNPFPEKPTLKSASNSS